jgi:hypothetical protein
LEKRLLSTLILIGVATLFSGCGGEGASEQENQEQDVENVDQTQTPVILTPIDPTNEPITIGDVGDVGEFWLNGSPLSTTYEEYLSGYWRGRLCGGSGFARVGINGTSAELNLGAGFIDPMFGSVSSNGEFSFSSREVSWDCEECGEVRPLETTGTVTWELYTGTIEFEVACSNSLGHSVSSIYVNLKNGITQPDPHNDLNRIQNDAIALIGDSSTCFENLHCKLMSLKSDDFCKFEALAYSVLDTDEEALLELQTEYRANEWLAYGSRGSSTTLCGFVREASCSQSKCM